ncbi:MAG TPA: ATP-binding protein [Roseiarcus sp.]|jgi:signal transduction histidine kinase
MWTVEVFNERAFRLALGFALTISVATAAAFAFIYLQVSRADVDQVSAILVDEAAKSAGDSEADLRRALELRLTRDIRRLDFVALIDPKGQLIFGNVPVTLHIPIDAKAHFLKEDVLPDANGDKDPAIFVARRRADGGVLLLGRSLREDYDLQETLLRALAIALLPTVLLILAIGAWFAHRASQRFKRVHDAIVRIMKGDLDLRLPFAGEDDIDKIARAVNLMLDEIARLLDHLKSAGDNIAHDLRTPLAVARAKLERALDNESGTEQLREALEAALAQIEKVSLTVSAILRISAVEHGPRETQFKDFDLAAVCAQLLDFYEPLAESQAVTLIAGADQPVPMRGDQDLMREALSNLIDNAIKFTPAGGTVRIEAGIVDGLPFAVVSDTGVGIPLQERGKIFDRFYRGAHSGKSPGHGLGLSIAATIARLHGFKLTVEDNNPGARFEFRAAAPASARREREPV